jgi:hypothetical protein
MYSSPFQQPAFPEVCRGVSPTGRALTWSRGGLGSLHSITEGGDTGGPDPSPAVPDWVPVGARSYALLASRSKIL